MWGAAPVGSWDFEPESQPENLVVQKAEFTSAYEIPMAILFAVSAAFFIRGIFYNKQYRVSRVGHFALAYPFIGALAVLLLSPLAIGLDCMWMWIVFAFGGLYERRSEKRTLKFELLGVVYLVIVSIFLAKVTIAQSFLFD